MFNKLHITQQPPQMHTAVFLGHYMGPVSALHTPWISRSRCETPITTSNSVWDTLVGWSLCLLGKCTTTWLPTDVCTYSLTRPCGEIVTAEITSVVLTRDLLEYTDAAREQINRSIIQVAHAYHPDHLILGANNKSGRLNGYSLDLYDAIPPSTTISHGNTLTTTWSVGTVMRYWNLLTYEYGKTPCVVITGASSSIGNVMVTMFLQQGCTVHYCGRHLDPVVSANATRMVSI